MRGFVSKMASTDYIRGKDSLQAGTGWCERTSGEFPGRGTAYFQKLYQGREVPVWGPSVPDWGYAVFARSRPSRRRGSTARASDTATASAF
jgi:hypothetical protein